MNTVFTCPHRYIVDDLRSVETLSMQHYGMEPRLECGSLPFFSLSLQDAAQHRVHGDDQLSEARLEH